MEKEGCLLVFENSMNERFGSLAKHHNLNLFEVGFDNYFSTSMYSLIKKRYKNRIIIKNQTEEIIKYINENKFKKVYLSNGEGYICMNIINELMKVFPEKEFIALQHGIFVLKNRLYIELARNFINRLSFLFSNFYIFGAGFGGINFDKYIVYSNLERNYLVEEKKWAKSDVVVDLNFLKKPLFEFFDKQIINQKNKNAVFYLQNLSSSGLCSEQDEIYLISKSLQYLSKKYTKVFLKDHPSCKDRTKHLDLPKNIKIIDSASDGFIHCKSAYSFFSTALIDAKVFKMKTYGIYSNRINVDINIYNNFDQSLSFENKIDI
ncbi:polysialyltransferase family glycosyltransferase [Urechidicola vernalis]|uniref:Uncharacterized protein n=1 Tax=Urechidicola vernalis TaxID=3075600 RepID=A0ABU2YAR9_9FLAO|nr:hypothetical protein [Urechidicola sp. P050]MDT0554158.1 hypothetical protein [Urechidicola sp. P050]